MEMFRNVGPALRILREHQGKSLRELAFASSVGKSQLSKYENRRELPKLPVLERLLDALSVPCDGFFSLVAFLNAELDLLVSPAEGSSFPKRFPLGALSPEVASAFERLSSASLELHRCVLLSTARCLASASLPKPEGEF